MMRWLVSSSLRGRKAVVLLGAVLLAFGFLQLRHADFDSLPEFDPPIVEVQTEALGLSAEEMEQLITTPLEQDLLNGVAWLDSIRSQSVPGLSSIVMEFEPDTDLYRARQVVQERLNEAHALPNVSRVPAMLQPQSSTSRALMVSLTSDELTPLELGVLARWTIVPRLTGVPGVSNVVTWGQKERQLQVQVDPERLADAGVTLDQVIRTTGNSLWASPLTFLEASTPGTGGFIDLNNQRLGVQHLSPIETAEELAQVAIEPAESAAAPTGPALRLGDVADVVEDHQPLIGEAVLRDGDGMILVVEKLPGASTTEVTEGVEDAIEAMRPGLSGVDIDTGVYRPATYVDHAADNLRRYALIGGALLLLGLAAFLLSWRRVLISAVAVGMSLLAAALVLYWRDATFNVVVLAGLLMALAPVVDDAVVNVDRAARRLGLSADVGASEAEPTGSFQVVLGAVLESGRTIGFALAAMVFALLPTFVLGGLAGESFYPELAVAFLVAVTVSMLVALTLTPALALLLLPAEASLTRGSPLVDGARRLYQRSLAGTVRRGAYVAVGGVALIVLGVLAFVQLDRSVLPPLKETDLLITWEGPPGASLPEMDRITSRAADELARLPGVTNVDAHVGRAVRGDAVGGANSGTIWVSLDSSADYGDTVQGVETVVSGYPGLDRKVVTYSQNRISDTLATERSPVRVRLYGQDLDVLQDKADEVSALVSDVGGTRDVRVQRITTEPTIEIEVDLVAAQEAGIKPGDVRRAATTLVSGIQVGALFEEQKIFEVQVWGVPEVRRNVTDIERLLLDVPGGGHVTLGDVADVRIGASPTSIGHDATSRSLDVTAAVSGRRVGDVVGDIEQRLADIAFPLEYHAEVLGDYGERTGAERRVLVFALSAALGIFLLLQAAFSSWRLAVVGTFALGVAVAGGALAAWIDGGAVTVATVAGLLAILALALRQILASIGRYQEVARSDPETQRAEVVERVTPDRVGAVVASIAVTALALLPMLVLGPIAGQELVHPMAIVMIGGLITTALATLYVVPPLYARFGPRSWPDDVAFAAPAPAEVSVPVGETVGAARRTGLTPMTYSEAAGRIDDV